jgi:Peptidogalycan biosysnthesis/recognition
MTSDHEAEPSTAESADAWVSSTGLASDGVCVLPWRASIWSDFDGNAPFPATAACLDATVGRIPGTSLMFLLRESGVTLAGLLGTVVTAAAPYEVFNLHHIILEPSTTLPLSEGSRIARQELAATVDPAAWSPSLILMYPNYECFAVGAAVDDPNHMDRLVGAIVDWAAVTGLRTVALLYLSALASGSASVLAQVLQARGFCRIPLSYACVLHLTGETIEDFLRTLPGKQRRDIQREIRRLAASGVSFGLSPLHDCFDDVIKLRCALVRKYRGVVDERAERHRLRQIAALWREQEIGVFHGTWNDHMLGFALFHGYRGTWYPYWTGADYDHPKHRGTYFQTVYYDPIMLAAQSGVRTIDYGQGSWQAKRARGCELVQLDGFIMPLRETLRPALKASAACTRLYR